MVYVCAPRNRHNDSEKASAGKLSGQAIARDWNRHPKSRMERTRGGAGGGAEKGSICKVVGMCAHPDAMPPNYVRRRRGGAADTKTPRHALRSPLRATGGRQRSQNYKKSRWTGHGDSEGKSYVVMEKNLASLLEIWVIVDLKSPLKTLG